MSYDALGRMVSYSDAPGGSISSASVSYAYDPDGNVRELNATYTPIGADRGVWRGARKRAGQLINLADGDQIKFNWAAVGTSAVNGLVNTVISGGSIGGAVHSPKPSPGGVGERRISRLSSTAAWRCLTHSR